jgi:phospholipid/cholesterol/gamma-HCH transport system substrate-binding protein
METRANYLLIGVVTIAVIAAIFWFVLWTLKGELDQQYSYYDIVFEDSVAGLNTAGDVLFQGINVGQVTDIRVDHDDPSRVRVTVRIQMRDDFVIRETSEATLQMQGITGVAFVQIVGGGADGAPLPRVSDPDEPRPMIPSRRSYIQELFESAPEVMAEALETLDAVQAILSEENQQSITGILADARALTSTIASRDEEIGQTIDSLSAFADSLGQTSDTLVAMSDDFHEAVLSINEAAESYTILAQDADRFLRRNEDSVEAFTQQGLAQFGYMIVEARQLISTLDRVAQRFESDPSGFLFGGGTTTAEVDVPD